MAFPSRFGYNRIQHRWAPEPCGRPGSEGRGGAGVALPSSRGTLFRSDTHPPLIFGGGARVTLSMLPEAGVVLAWPQGGQDIRIHSLTCSADVGLALPADNGWKQNGAVTEHVGSGFVPLD